MKKGKVCYNVSITSKRFIMHSSYKASFLSLLVFVFLIPLFFIPSGMLPLAIGKTVILTLGVIVAFIALLIEALRQGGVSIPSTYVLWGVIALPVVYAVSALASAAPSLSLFGYNFETGSFSFILIGSAILAVTAIVVTSAERLLRIYGAILLSFVLLIVFAFIKIVTQGNALTFGALKGVVGNPVGAWTDYAIGFGLIAVLSIFALDMLVLKKAWRSMLYAVLALSMILLAALNFSIAWYVTLGAALIALVYILTVEKPSQSEHRPWRMSRIAPAAVLFVVSLFFAINPTISGAPVGNTVSNQFHVSVSDVRPSFSSTFFVAKQVLAKDALLGSGPNTFDRDWLMYRPNAINATTFWNAAFPFGVGYLPTAVATTGVLGTLTWLAFLIAFLVLGARSLRRISQSSERYALISSFVGALFLWAAAILYVPSAAILSLAFLFTGLFVASACMAGIVPSRMIVFRRSPALNFGFVLLIIVLGIGSLAFGLVGYQKVASVIHFEKALALSQTPGTAADSVEVELERAIALSPADIYYGSLSELSFARAQGILQNPTTTPEATQVVFQSVFQKSIASADTATKLNPGSYQNWIRLGGVYAALVPSPLSVAGAYESAKAAFEQAGKLSPESPEPYLLQARLEISHNNPTAARNAIQDAITKKQDYVDAYYLLTQLDVQQNNVPEAIQAAQATAILSPNNAGVFFELGLLKYSTQDYQGAAEALARAIEIVPEYANAKYFLGLSLDKLGKHDLAIAQFRDLARANPDNQDVALILANLEAGHDAFYKAPVGTKKPEKRDSPPIKSNITQE